jgi:hypothetical protein
MDKLPEEIFTSDATPNSENTLNSALQEKYRNRTLINQRYIFEKKIGAGSFGTVYKGKNIISGDGVAIKFEATTAKLPTLLWESKILNHLAGTAGVVKLRYFGVEANKNIIVMDLFSHSLFEEIEKINTGTSKHTTKPQNNSTESQEELISEKDTGKKGTISSSERDNTGGIDVKSQSQSQSQSPESSIAGGEGENGNDDETDSMLK